MCRPSIDQDIRHCIYPKRAYQTLKALTNSSTKKKTRMIENKYRDIISEYNEMVKDGQNTVMNLIILNLNS